MIGKIIISDERQSSKDGMTIIELLVSVSIISLCIAMSVGAFYSAYKMMYFTRMLNLSHNEVKNAVDKISVFARQAIYYPRIYSNGVPSVISIQTNISSGVTSLTQEIAGNELYIMYNGTIAEIPADLPANSTQITFSNSTTLSPTALIPSVIGVVNSNVTSSAFEASKGTIFRSQDVSYLPVPYDSLLIRTIGESPTNVQHYLVTNVTSGSGTFTLYLSSPTTTAFAKSTVVFIGPEARLLVTNNNLLFFENLNSSQNSVLLENNNTAKAPFTMSYPGQTLKIDLRYVSEGDVTGKGIYRIITRSTMRTNPDYRKTKLYMNEGYVAGEPDDGDN